MYKTDSHGNLYYDGTGLQIMRGIEGGGSSIYLDALKTTYYANSTNSIIDRTVSEYDTSLNGTINNTIKRIYPTITNDITKIDYVPLATRCDAYSEVGLLYPDESLDNIKQIYDRIVFTVNDDLEYMQSDYNNYKINESKTFFYDKDDEKLIDARYRWAVLNDYNTYDRKIHIPFVKKIDYDPSLKTVEVMRYYLRFKLKTSGITSDEYTDTVNSLYKGNGSSPVPNLSQGTSNFAIPSQLCYTKFVTIGPIGYDSTYNLRKGYATSDDTGKYITKKIDSNHENRNRVVAHSVPPYKLYSIFFYHGELFIQEDYFTRDTILHDSIKNDSQCSITNIMEYYYPSITGDYSRMVKLASNLPENKLYILINGQGGGGAWHQISGPEEYTNTYVSGGNAGNAASLILLMKDTYGTNTGLSSNIYPQCIIKMPACPTQSTLVAAENAYRYGAGNSNYDCEIFYDYGQRFVVRHGKGGIIGSSVKYDDNSNFDNYYATYDSDPITLGDIYGIENTTVKPSLSSNGYHLMPFRASTYTCKYYEYDDNKNFKDDRTFTWNMIENIYFHGNDAFFNNGIYEKYSYILCGGTPSIFARGGCMSKQISLSVSQDRINIDGSYGSGGGAYTNSYSYVVSEKDDLKLFCGAGGAAAFTIGWYETNPS